MLKTCSSCREIKNKSEFYADARTPDGLYCHCKSCRSVQYKARHPKKQNALDPIERTKRRQRTYRARHARKIAEYAKEYKGRNKDKIRAATQLRREQIRRATPQWLTPENKKKIALYYSLAARLTSINGYTMSVDHIVPINGVSVSGLHVPWNLQIIPLTENMSKGINHGR